MFSLVIALFSLAVSTASATEGCYEYQVCEEVCTDLEVSSVTLSRSVPTRWITEPLQSCETVCTIDEYCPPIDTTNGGEGADYSEDEFAGCHDLPLISDQIRCIQALLG